MIELAKASLCCDCEKISEATGSCRCGSKSLLNLARVLNRETVEEEFKKFIKIIEVEMEKK